MTDPRRPKDALERSDERLRLAKAAAGIGVYDYDVETRAIEWDARLRELWGVEASAPVTYELYMSGIHPEDRARVQAGIERALDPSGDGRISSQHRVVNRIDGITRWIAATGQVSFVDGKARRLVGAVQDVTAAKSAEAALRTSEERLRLAAEANAKFRTLFEQGTQFAGILSLDGVVLEANRLSLDACGFTRDEIVGKPFWDCGWWNRSSALRETVRVATLAAASGTPCRAESTYFVADGRERMVDLAIVPVTGDDGGVLFIAATGNDITERKAAEARLRLLDALSEATRASSDPFEIMVATTRLLGTYLGATRCAYADVEADNDRFTIPHDWTAEGATSTVGSYELDRFGVGVAACLRAGTTLVVRDVDVAFGPDDGASMFNAMGIKATITCPLVKQGRLVAMMAVHQVTPRDWTDDDVSLVEEVVERSWAHIERARAVDALRAQDRRKDEFLATLAHELRNPLAPIRAGLHVLKASAGAPSGRTVEIMNRQLGHMVRLIDDLLDVSRINGGKFELRRERVSIQSVIDDAVEASRPILDAGNHTLNVRVPTEVIWVDGDLTRLAQVVSNLLNNAAKYTPARGRVDLSVDVDGGDVVLRVSDDGSGISAAMLPRVFDLFAQADQTRSRAQGGLGIGLSLVRKLVGMHGGTVTAASEGVGRGSVFTVRLSKARAAAPERIGAELPPTETSLRKRRILVVDDNVDGAEMLVAMLQVGGHDTRFAVDGASAIAEARTFLPELVFLDLGMPEMDGFAVAKALREETSLDGVVLVALTGWGTADDKGRTREAGFDFHLTKPVGFADVERVLSRALP